MSIRILLADDHGVIRQGLRSLLEKEPDIEVVAETEDGRRALEIVRERVELRKKAQKMGYFDFHRLKNKKRSPAPSHPR